MYVLAMVMAQLLPYNLAATYVYSFGKDRHFVLTCNDSIFIALPHILRMIVYYSVSSSVRSFHCCCVAAAAAVFLLLEIFSDLFLWADCCVRVSKTQNITPELEVHTMRMERTARVASARKRSECVCKFVYEQRVEHCFLCVQLTAHYTHTHTRTVWNMLEISAWQFICSNTTTTTTTTTLTRNWNSFVR